MKSEPAKARQYALCTRAPKACFWPNWILGKDVRLSPDTYRSERRTVPSSMSISHALKAPIVRGLLLVAVGGCGGGTEPALVPCSGNLAIVVSTGTTPSFTWTPQCGANRLRVDVVDPVVGASGTEWEISSVSGQFGPPVRYGTTPDGADVGVAPAPLRTGTAYRVTVLRAGGEAISLGAGSTVFTP
jgi:hypothetical protein